MKRIIMLVLALALMGSVAWGETFKFFEEPKTKEKAPAIERKIQVDQKKEYLQVTVYPKDTQPIVYRIWPCGKIERMEWKEIAGNKENGITAGSLIAVPAVGWSTLQITH